MLKSANVSFAGWQSVGSGLVTAFVEEDVAAVKAATDAGTEAANPFWPSAVPVDAYCSLIVDSINVEP